MTSGILFDVGINTEALSDDEFPITESELGMIEESGILIDGGVGTNALSEDEFDIVPDSEPERIERALANVSQAEPSNPQPQSPQLRSPIPSPVQLPIPSPSPEPQPQTAFHIYAGAFPSQEAAMTNRYYTDSITICIVEDPRLVLSTVENEGEDYWMVKSDSIPSRWMRSFEEGIPQAGKKNACWEWVHVLYALHKKTGSSRLFSLKWTSFKNGLLKQNWKVWEVLKSSDLVLGGIPLSGDFMSVKDAFTCEELPMAMESLKTICKMTNVFPTPDQELWLGQKLMLMDGLAEIAERVTKTHYPKYFEIKDPRDGRLSKRGDLRIKRGYSERRLHVPQNSLDVFREKLQKWVEDTEQAYDHDVLRQLGVEARWIGTSYVETLKWVGEMRVYFVGGVRRKTLWTLPKAGGLSLSQKSEDFIEGVGEKKGKLKMEPEGFEKVKEGFRDFVEESYRALVKKAEKDMGTGNSDLRVFCRLDVAAMRVEESEGASEGMGFFVNGVRGMGAGLFFSYAGQDMEEFSKDIAIALRTWVAIRRSVREEVEGVEA
ncbi:hypothetical protein F5887DRAFT_923674 [Amanita rubescens]|nr:hypothetical protein F5887DRAFT_923674 [Amanita rubescens]